MVRLSVQACADGNLQGSQSLECDSQEPDHVTLEEKSPRELGKRDKRDESAVDDKPGHTPREQRCHCSSRWPRSWPGHVGNSKLEGAPHARFCINENAGIIFAKLNPQEAPLGVRVVSG